MSNNFWKITSLFLTLLALVPTGLTLLAQDHAHAPLTDCDVDALVAHQLEHAAVLETLADDLLHDPDSALQALYTTGIAYQALAIECGFDRTAEADAAHDLEHGIAANTDILEVAMTIGDPDNGAELFNLVQPQNGFACSTCHVVNSVDRLIGPGLLGIGAVGHDPGEHAEGEAETMSDMTEDEHAESEENHGGMAMHGSDDPAVSDATEEAHTERTLEDVVAYIRTSILHPNDYIVPGYPESLMPQNYAEILSDEEIDDLVAYLLTLQ